HAIMGARLSHGTKGKSLASDGASAWSSGAVSWRSAGLPIDGAAAFRGRGGRPDSDPGRNSLRLLPSGPDRVGEGPAHRRPPAALYQVRPAPRQGRSGGGHAPFTNQANPGNVGGNSGLEAVMTVKLYAFTCGTLTGEFARLMEGGPGDITVPIPAFLIEHPKGRALFDTGLHPDCQRDPAARLGPRLAGLFDIAFQPGEEVSARLEAIGRDPGKIDVVI